MAVAASRTFVVSRVGSSLALPPAGDLSHSCTKRMEVTEEGGLWSWGMGAQGMLGHNNGKDRVVPVRVKVEGLDRTKIVSAACGKAHSEEVTEEGSSSCRQGSSFFL